MAWRMIMRRIPNRWMTIIGDTAQTGDLAGTTAWADVLQPYVKDRWQLRELTVNYRTPGEIMRYASRILAQVDPDQSPPTSLRDNGIQPVAIPADPAGAAITAVRAAAAPELTGLTGIVVPDALVGEATAALTASLDDDPDRRPRLHTVTSCKGLEFDNTVVVDPAALIAQSPRGYSDLYVAVTRSTQRLVVVHTTDLPPELADLPAQEPSGETTG